MALWFDTIRNQYIGERVTIDAELFEEAVAELLEGGVDESVARSRLLDEAEWLDDEAANLPLCLHCRQPLPPDHQCCDVICQAACIADVHG